MRFRRRPGMQDAFDGLTKRDAERLRAFLDHGGSMLPRAGAPAVTTKSVHPSRPDPGIVDEPVRRKGKRA